ncbi:hypothetical protein POSPLADRAFT_1142659 [Postia placenta MAD-698-R-SB12]|uniref:Six-hairpin glycosidase-like protein n=1 Tax=Postia placenta MAD-698-R-SB12 TaxID=670580 RepID=A0A1X6N0J5_9APHY|nr:hypothetical protein POSPLADRAFT_1142659 [Postia placenta MAD-698-R-SB12]OSX62141.1 hypothetical protein POSPLADRAFT_1142659 [Postia placenta MAD-698-R-SB12]
MQVGNGFFAFGADISGLQTFQPWAIMSDWGWKNDSLPAGLLFIDGVGNVQNITEADLSDARQELDLWSGTITSTFAVDGHNVTVKTYTAQNSSTVGIAIHSTLVQDGRLCLFLDFPWNDGSQKFQAPYVGYWNDTNSHTTALTAGPGLGENVLWQISHTMSAASFYTTLGGGDNFTISRVSPTTHRYRLVPVEPSSSFSITVGYSPSNSEGVPSVAEMALESISNWKSYWSSSGFVDVVSGSTDPRAEELQRRIILSRYLMRVNEAGFTPPQESGLVDDGWVSNRAQSQEGYKHGARWSKMTDPTGRSAPGEINELLIWQQPHPLVFAEYEYRATQSRETLERWQDVVYETADWMANYARYNTSTGVHDLGPPMYVVSEDTSPNVTRNPAFELAYWRLGLDLAQAWMERLGEEVPVAWGEVKENLAPLPIEDGLYAVYEGIESDFWTTTEYTNSHPALVGLYGWLPQTSNVSLEIAKATAERVRTTWNITNLWGWDFPILAMSAARLGDADKAIDWLLDPYYQFDDVGMPLGGAQVPTPYFPGSGGLLYAVAMMARGWDGTQGAAPGFPREGWGVKVEDISPAL